MNHRPANKSTEPRLDLPLERGTQLGFEGDQWQCVLLTKPRGSRLSLRTRVVFGTKVVFANYGNLCWELRLSFEQVDHKTSPYVSVGLSNWHLGLRLPRTGTVWAMGCPLVSPHNPKKGSLKQTNKQTNKQSGKQQASKQASTITSTSTSTSTSKQTQTSIQTNKKQEDKNQATKQTSNQTNKHTHKHKQTQTHKQTETYTNKHKTTRQTYNQTYKQKQTTRQAYQQQKATNKQTNKLHQPRPQTAKRHDKSV